MASNIRFRRQTPAEGGKQPLSDFSAIPIFSPCQHLNVVPVAIGRRWFEQGEVEDNIQVLLQCMDCLEIVSEAEVRAAWQGMHPDFQKEMEDEDVDF